MVGTYYNNPINQACAARGDIIVGNATGTLTTVSAGTSGKVFTSNGAGTLPTWETPIVYAESTWTPTLVGTTGTIGAQAYSAQTGYYIKIGKLVTVWGTITMTNKGSWTGSAQIQSLPFTSGSVAGRQFISARSLTFTGGGDRMVGQAFSASSVIGLQTETVAGVASNQVYTDFADDTTLHFCFTYMSSS